MTGATDWASFTAPLVGNLRRYWKIPRFVPAADPPEGPLVNVRQAAKILRRYPQAGLRAEREQFMRTFLHQFQRETS